MAQTSTLDRVGTWFSILASAATALAVGVAIVQLNQDRAVRLAQAKLDAIALLLPKYTTVPVRVPNTAPSALFGNPPYPHFTGSSSAKFQIHFDVFNDTGLSLRHFGHIMLCRNGHVEPLGNNGLPIRSALRFGDGARLNAHEVAFLQQGRNTATIEIEGLGDAQMGFLLYDVVFYDIGVPDSIARNIEAALSGYVDKAFLASFRETDGALASVAPTPVLGQSDPRSEHCGINYLEVLSDLRAARAAQAYNRPVTTN